MFLILSLKADIHSLKSERPGGKKTTSMTSYACAVIKISADS